MLVLFMADWNALKKTYFLCTFYVTLRGGKKYIYIYTHKYLYILVDPLCPTAGVKRPPRSTMFNTRHLT